MCERISVSHNVYAHDSTVQPHCAGMAGYARTRRKRPGGASAGCGTLLGSTAVVVPAPAPSPALDPAASTPAIEPAWHGPGPSLRRRAPWWRRTPGALDVMRGLAHPRLAAGRPRAGRCPVPCPGPGHTGIRHRGAGLPRASGSSLRPAFARTRACRRTILQQAGRTSPRDPFPGGGRRRRAAQDGGDRSRLRRTPIRLRHLPPHAGEGSCAGLSEWDAPPRPPSAPSPHAGEGNCAGLFEWDAPPRPPPAPSPHAGEGNCAGLFEWMRHPARLRHLPRTRGKGAALVCSNGMRHPARLRHLPRTRGKGTALVCSNGCATPVRLRHLPGTRGKGTAWFVRMRCAPCCLGVRHRAAKRYHERWDAQRRTDRFSLLLRAGEGGAQRRMGVAGRACGAPSSAFGTFLRKRGKGRFIGWLGRRLGPAPVGHAGVQPDTGNGADAAGSPARSRHPQLRIGVPGGSALRKPSTASAFGFTTTGDAASRSSGMSAAESE